MSQLIPLVDEETKLFPQATMDALAAALPGATPEQVEMAVTDYLLQNPPQVDGSLLEAHITSLTPHPAYDEIPSLTLLFENGLI